MEAHEAHRHIQKLADHHRSFAKLHRSVAGRHGEFEKGHAEHAHLRLSELHKGMKEDHEALAGEHDAFAQNCDDLAECMKSWMHKEDAAEKLWKGAQLQPTQVSSIAPPPGLRAIPRSGGMPIPERPPVSLEFERVFGLNDDD